MFRQMYFCSTNLEARDTECGKRVWRLTGDVTGTNLGDGVRGGAVVGELHWTIDALGV